MNSNPEVEITLACRYGNVGHRFRPNGTLRDWLVNNGFAKVVEDPRPARLTGKAAKKIAEATKGMFG